MTFGDWDLSPSRFREPFRSPGHREWRTASYDWGRRLRRPRIMKTSADTEVTWFPGQDAIEALLKDSSFEKATEYILPGSDEFCVRAGLRPDPKLLDAPLPRISLDDLPNVPARRAFAVVAHLVCLCLLGGVVRSSAAPATFSTPGAVTVSIQPPEAVAVWPTSSGRAGSP